MSGNNTVRDKRIRFHEHEKDRIVEVGRDIFGTDSIAQADIVMHLVEKYEENE